MEKCQKLTQFWKLFKNMRLKIILPYFLKFLKKSKIIGTYVKCLKFSKTVNQKQYKKLLITWVENIVKNTNQ